VNKKCEKCGKFFEAKQEFLRICPQCFSDSARRAFQLPPELLLKTYYDSEGNLLKEVFMGPPEEISKILARDDLAVKQLRDFHLLIARARNKAILKDINVARPLLYECQRNVEYQLKRKVIPQSFGHFMKHHLAIAEKDEKNLEGFFQHLESVVAFYPTKEKGGVK